MRLIGLEPTQPELPDPKSGASTNFATGAVCGCKDSKKVSSFQSLVLSFSLLSSFDASFALPSGHTKARPYSLHSPQQRSCFIVVGWWRGFV